MGNPEATQYEQYWRQRIGADIDSLTQESWGNDAYGLLYSDGLLAAADVARLGRT